MKICIVADRMDQLGGLESHVIGQINGLLGRGHEVLLSVNAISEANLCQISGPDPSRQSFFLDSPWWADPMSEAVRDFHPEIIHSHPFSSIFRGLEIARELNIPFFITMHGLYSFGVDKSPDGYRASKAARSIICVDNAVKDLLDKATPFPEKLVTMYNSLDLNKFKPLERDYNCIGFKLNPDWPTITSICRLDDSKELHVYRLLDCAPRLAYFLGGLNVLIVGDGSHMTQVKERNRKAIEECRYLNLGIVGARSCIPAVLSVSDLTVAAARAAMESIACGVPVFIAGVAGVGGLINSEEEFAYKLMGVTGHKWDYTDEKMILELGKGITDRDYRDLIIPEGLEFIRQSCDISVAMSRLVSMYDWERRMTR